MKKVPQEVVDDLVEWFKQQKSPPTLTECMEHSGLKRDSVRRYLAKHDLRIPMGTRVGSSRGPYKRREKKTCPCGTPVAGVLYCSPECRKLYGRYKKSRPLRTITCLGCAEDFTIPDWECNRKRKYCSNECAKREQKKGWGKVGVETPDGVLVLRSMYELRFVAVCERHGWDWRNYDGPAFDTPLGKYRPDFVVEGEVVEVKGWVNDRSRAVRASAREAGVKVRLVDIRLLERLEDGRFT